MDSDREAFGKRLHELMVARGMNQSALAHAADMARNNISVYVNGRSYPSAEARRKLAKALGVTPDDVLADRYVRGERGGIPGPARSLVERQLDRVEKKLDDLLGATFEMRRHAKKEPNDVFA